MKDSGSLASRLEHGSLAWKSSKLEVRTRNHEDRGLFALEQIRKNEVLTVMGGAILNRTQIDQLEAHWMSRTIQVEEDLFQVSIRDDEPADFMNHSCKPNAGMSGQVVTVAMRDIEPDEEVVMDYAMADSADFDCFRCKCGSTECRGEVKGSDWRNPILRAKYGSYFSDYLKRRIKRLDRDTSSKYGSLAFGEHSFASLHPSLEIRETGDARGRGLFTTEAISQGSRLWHDNLYKKQLVRFDEFERLSDDALWTLLHFAWQVDDETVEGPLTIEHAAADASNVWNHSCDPNSWMNGDDEITARRHIDAGEEITADYATWAASPILFAAQLPGPCLCGSSLCRRQITHEDWRLPELRDRYGEHFSGFIKNQSLFTV